LLVAEVVVQARLVLEPRLRGDLPHRDAGEAALREAALRCVEDHAARRGRLTGAGDGGARAHCGPRTWTNVRLSRQSPGEVRMSRMPVVDADGHVTEPPTMWADYVDPAFRARAPRPVLDERGRPCQLLDDRIVMRHAMLLTFGPDYDIAAGRIQ